MGRFEFPQWKRSVTLADTVKRSILTGILGYSSKKNYLIDSYIRAGMRGKKFDQSLLFDRESLLMLRMQYRQ